MVCFNNFQKYIDEHITERITIGKSGASVYELDHIYIAKHIRRNLMQSGADWDSYRREAQFYSSFTSENFSFLPKVYHCSQTDDEIQLIMEKYCPVNRYNLDDTMLEKVFDVLAQIHNMTIPEFLPKMDTGALQLEEDEINQYLSGWCNVIREHGDVFSESDLIKIGENINTINKQAYTPKKMCCHGDFHFDNLLVDDEGKIIVCDWQNVNSGHVSGDISFFLSRLSADGLEISKEKAVQMYCRFSTADIIHDEISMQMSLANLNTSFIHWHNYLRGCSIERVRGIWDKMIEDAEYLYSVCIR